MKPQDKGYYLESRYVLRTKIRHIDQLANYFKILNNRLYPQRPYIIQTTIMGCVSIYELHLGTNHNTDVYNRIDISYESYENI